MNDYILEIKKVIPKVLCQKIIRYFDHDYDDASTVGGLNKNIRNCLTKSLLEPKTFGEKICSNAVKEKVFECVSHYKKQYGVHITRISQLDLLKYEANSFDAGYKFHEDFGDKATERHLSISICLNNEYYGGEFVFNINKQELTYPQNIGDAIVFPSNFMFPHQVNKVTKGTRYALIGWVI
jgi:predicted 2-oxoglutarate/Fe(II)-dependent dioxygenase YbiX